jgi:hypothetical protein
MPRSGRPRISDPAITSFSSPLITLNLRYLVLCL